MRIKIINFLKTHPRLVLWLWTCARHTLYFISWFVPVQKKTILFISFGGRGFNDSPKALYDEICNRDFFNDWKLLWAFVNPDAIEIPRGEKIKVDTYAFFKTLLQSQIWISNSDADRGIGLKLKRTIRVETWHGTPLKKIGGEENTETFAVKPENYNGPIDYDTIRCAQSEFDREIFARIFHASKDSILLSDLPRNDELFHYTSERLSEIRKSLNISQNVGVILYTPTYREYLINNDRDTYIAPPINFEKWNSLLNGKFVLLIRAHYAVTKALNIVEDDFIKDVSKYPSINDLYAISDMMISDYSSTFFDYSILDRPVFCFAYDLEEYVQKRGLYLDLKKELPCTIHYNEESLLNDILTVDIERAKERTKVFHEKYAPMAGHASSMVVNEIQKRLKQI